MYVQKLLNGKKPKQSSKNNNKKFSRFRREKYLGMTKDLPDLPDLPDIIGY